MERPPIFKVELSYRGSEFAFEEGKM